jgi:hypothetical protein
VKRAYESVLPLKGEELMQNLEPEIARSAREDALKRRNASIREMLGIGPSPDADKPQEPKESQKPDE